MDGAFKPKNIESLLNLDICIPNGSKSHRRNSITDDRICIKNRDGSKFELFIFPLFSLRNMDHVSFCRSGSLFKLEKLRWLKIRREIEFEAK